MENSQPKEEIREAFTHPNGEANEAPINTKALNDKVNMLVKAMEDLVFTSSSKNVRQDSSTPKRSKENGEEARRTRPLTRKNLEDRRRSIDALGDNRGAKQIGGSVGPINSKVLGAYKFPLAQKQHYAEKKNYFLLNNQQ